MGTGSRAGARRIEIGCRTWIRTKTSWVRASQPTVTSCGSEMEIHFGLPPNKSRVAAGRFVYFSMWIRIGPPGQFYADDLPLFRRALLDC